MDWLIRVDRLTVSKAASERLQRELGDSVEIHRADGKAREEEGGVGRSIDKKKQSISS